MTPQELKNSILQLAIQGKLVEQRPEEGMAQELYKEIQAEKQKLIKEGKIKKEKPLPEITEDEKPFDIPESWMWCKITDCGSFVSGFTPKSSELYHSGTLPYFKVSDMNTLGNELYLLNTQNYLINSKKFFLANTIVYPKNGGALFTNKKRILAQNSVVDLNTGGYFPFSPLNIMFVYYFFQNVDFRQCYKGTALPTIDMVKLKGKYLPLPPLAEQKRIVAKIEELLPLIDRYEVAWSKLEAFNKRFPEDMQKSILQQAIQGKLVEQRPEEGTGEELYHQILAEKQRLIKEKKIKKDKPLPEITDDEKPFDIPESWKWVRLGDLITVRGGKRLPAGEHLITNITNHVYIRVTDMKNDTVDLSDLHYITDSLYERIKNYIIKKDDIYIVIVGSTIGKVGIIPDILDSMNLTENAARLTPYFVNKKYLLYALKTSFLQSQFYEKTNQVGQPKLALIRLKTSCIPLPPLAEQKRIVAKIEQLLPLCDMLK